MVPASLVGSKRQLALTFKTKTPAREIGWRSYLL